MKIIALAVAAALGSSGAMADTNQWQSGWGQGKTEFFVGNERESYLNFACDENDESNPISASATIAGHGFYSHNDKGGFDVVLDGVEFSNPFFVECNACSRNFPEFWDSLRKAKSIELKADGLKSAVSSKGLSALTEPYEAPGNACGTGYW